MKKAEAKLGKRLYSEVRKLGRKFNLSFAGYTAFHSTIIALDKIKKRLLVARSDEVQPHIIDLDQVEAVIVKKSYGSIQQGELQNTRLEEFLKRIDLQLAFNNGATIFVLPFYQSAINDIREHANQESKARYWQKVLSKISGSKEKKDKKQTP